MNPTRPIPSRNLVLVAGGAGYVGSVLVPRLLEQGFAVRVFDKLLFGDEGLRSEAGRIEIVSGDIRRFDPAVLDGVDIVINLAGLSNDPMAEFQPAANRAMNTDGAVHLATVARARGVRRFLQASSCSIYDRGRDAADVLLDETAAVAPTATYAISKLDAERRLFEVAGDDLEMVALRKGTVYGWSPRMRYDLVVNTFVKDALTKAALTVHHGGEMWRPLVDVRDVAAAYVALCAAPRERVHGQIFNLVFENYRVSELAHRVRQALAADIAVAVEVQYDRGPARSYRVSGRKLAEALAIVPRWSVEEAARDIVKRIREGCAADFHNPRYYNIEWLRLLLEVERQVRFMGSVL